MQTKDDFLSRFLGISQDDVETTEDNKTLMDMVSETYDQMPDKEIMKFQNELSIDHSYIEFEGPLTMEQRLHRFNQHIDIVSRVVSNDTLFLNNPESDVEYYGSDEFFRSDYVSVYWSHEDYEKICTLPHRQDDEQIIYRVMEIAESVHYHRESFEQAIKSEVEGAGQVESRPPTKAEVETILNKIRLLSKAGQSEEVQQLTETFIQKWDLENIQDNLPGMDERLISLELEPTIAKFPDLEWAE